MCVCAFVHLCVYVGGVCQQFRGPRGPILSRKESATEINEAQHSEEHQSHWCRPRAATPTSLQTNHNSQDAMCH